MTRSEAIVKIRKVLAQAKGTSNPHEKETALKQASRLMAAHALTDTDLSEDNLVVAYDEIVKEAKEFTDKSPPITTGIFGAFNVIGELLTQSTGHLPPAYKSKIVKKLSDPGNRKMAILMLGSQYAPLMAAIENVLKNHNL
jgi:hypothetical protein